MAIDILNTGLTHNLNGMCISFDLIRYNTATIIATEEDREYDLCCYNNIVLADNTGVANQNDVNSFMFLLAASTDTLNIFLEKDSVEVVQITDDTLGKFYELGSITYYPDQALLKGCIIYWANVLNTYGVGKYRLRFDYTTLGVANSFYSITYNLKTFSWEIANNTIRIESYMDGYLMKERINYKGLNFPDMIRVRGFFGNEDEKFEVTNDIYSNLLNEKRVVVQRKVNQFNIYNFETLPLPKCIADKIKYYHFFGNTIYVSDYNKLNYNWELERIRIYKDAAFDYKYTKTTRGVIIKGKLNEQIQDLQKTNC